VIACTKAKKLQGGLMTFDPHPMKVLAPNRDIRTIFDLEDRINTVRELGLDFIVIEPFSRALSELAPRDFFKSLLVEKLNLKYLFVGHDFSFGRHREGNPQVLQKLCDEHGVVLEVVPPVKIRGEIVSSSKIRECIADGSIEKANTFLGRRYYLRGVIEKGAGRGRKIGFPTANLFASSELFPMNGVYVTFFEIGGKSFRSVTSVGRNPTFAQSTKRPIQVETFIFDFDRDIYGHQAKVSFLHCLRGEVKFDSVGELIEQIKNDVDEAKRYPWPPL
jgi:riboflavin kinase / FMN adenylyltransferase